VLALVIDTSSAAVTAGVVEVTGPQPPAVLAERVTVDARAHGELLTPSLQACLAGAGVSLGQLDAIVAGLGPGPFTGLRVGLVTAAALADATGLPAYGVCSLDAIAAGHQQVVLLPFERHMFGTEAWSRQSYLDELADTELRYYLVAETPTGELLGNAGLLTIGTTAEILTVGVLPAARRRGVGRLLVRALVAEARRRRASEVLLEVRIDNEAARGLYQDEGFTVLGLRRGYYDSGRVDAVTMRYEL
jgi:ribosomal-protein-alanine N-acetyltransferase